MPHCGSEPLALFASCLLHHHHTRFYAFLLSTILPSSVFATCLHLDPSEKGRIHFPRDGTRIPPDHMVSFGRARDEIHSVVAVQHADRVEEGVLWPVLVAQVMHPIRNIGHILRPSLYGEGGRSEETLGWREVREDNRQGCSSPQLILACSYNENWNRLCTMGIESCKRTG